MPFPLRHSSQPHQATSSFLGGHVASLGVQSRVARVHLWQQKALSACRQRRAATSVKDSFYFLDAHVRQIGPKPVLVSADRPT
jgi:hypothetical protein